MDQETVGNIVLLAIVTLISVVQNGFFAHKVEHESKTQNGRSFQRTGTLAFERVYTAKWRKAKGKIRVPFSMSTQSVVHHIEHSRVTCRQIGKGISTGDCKKEDIGEPKLCGRVPHVPCRALERGAALQPSSRRLCWPDVPVREAKILRRLPGGENSEHTGLHIWEANHTVPVPHVPCRNLQLLSHLLFRK
ncbi:arachidonate 5-lipoxygenase-activating protein isoform X2 [Lynx rufus]|uniref:arachidonate 5-lipoxygenase-activating protein isoform X2 n=1 Tax=Lynx rufus TaxID=61384 RepID=UPI001F124B53|nr:arachidonate 5-lipoxygenase-activating protein isoform X2 [Lynx rufus]